MMSANTRKISSTFEQLPGVLQSVLYQEQRNFTQAPSGTTALTSARQVAIVDQDEQRRLFIARALEDAGYRPQVAANVLEAYTKFLGGTLFPLALILLCEEPADRFFLQRFSQHMMQKYSWDVPLIHLSFPSRMQITEPVTTPLPLKRPRLTQRLSERPAELEPKQKAKISLDGQSLGRYHIQSRLEYDGSGDVYRAYDRLREYDVAFKALQTSPQAFEEAGQRHHVFQRERDMLDSLNHPHILPLFNCGKSYITGSPFFYKTMPYCPEGSLAAWRYQHGGARPFPPQEVAAIVQQLAETLEYAHGQQVIFGNFKLSNVLVSSQADTMSRLDVKLVDFMAPDDEAKMLQSMRYMAPERWYGQSLPVSDQYGLAALAYELLTGRPPFPCNSQQILQRMHLSSQPQPASAFNPKVSRALDAVLLRALAKKPQDRFRNMAEFAAGYERNSKM